MTTACFAIQPFQIAMYRETLPELETRFANFWGGFGHPFRLLTRTRRFSFMPRQQELRIRTQPFDKVRELASLLETLQPEQRHQLVGWLRQHEDVIAGATAQLPNAHDVRTALQQLSAGQDDEVARRTLLDAATSAMWSWRWLKNHQRLYDTLEQHAPPLTIDHFLLCWPDQHTNVDALQQVLKATFLVPSVEPVPLPPLFEGIYEEEADYLAPTEPGYPYMTVLTAWDMRGVWDLTSLSSLLMSDYELALAIDVRTLPRATAQRRTADALTVLHESVYGKFAVNDARTRRAHESASVAFGQLDVQALHELSCAILLWAATLPALNQQAQTLRDLMGLRMQFDRVRGAQAEYLKLFTSQPASLIDAPLVRRNTLSVGVAVKTPWGLRKTNRLNGTLWGYNPHEGMPIHYDLWGAKQVENAHLMMVGKAGSGKTVDLLTMSLRQAMQGDQVVFFDPVGKCRWLSDAVGAGAAYYNIETNAAINILDPLSIDLGRQRDHVARKLSIVLGRAYQEGGRDHFTPRSLSNFELGGLDRALQDEAIYGADGHRLRRLATAQPEHSPRLEQLVQALRAVARRERLPEAETLAREIELLLLGSRAAIFNQPTTLRWDFSSDVVAYDFQAADAAMLPLLYSHGFEALNRWVRDRERLQRGQRLITVFDEFRFMASVAALEAYVAMATKTWRNYGGAMWTADQNATTYFGHAGTTSEWGPFISNNTLIKIFFRQEASEADMIGHAYRDQLAPEHVQQIKTSGTGEAVVMLGDEVHTLVMQLTDLEAQYFLR